MSESISHKGVVIKVTPQVTTVSFTQHGACSECHAAGLCGMGDVAQKVIEVPTDPYTKRQVGDEVDVLLKASMGFKAVYLAYLIPLLIILAVILSLLALGVQEVAAALAGLGAVALYYLLLWLFRSKLQNEYVFVLSSPAKREDLK